MDLNIVIAELRRLNDPVPSPVPLPTQEQLAQIESELNLELHSDFRKYLLGASDVVYGTLEPVTITVPHSHTHFPSVVRSARELGVPTHLVPICEDNGDFYCIEADGKIVFWCHNGVSNESWRDLATWIKEVWIGERHAAR